MKNSNIKGCFVAVILLLLSHLSMAQLGVGQWRTHLSYAFLQNATQSQSHVYAASEKSIFRYHKENGSIELYTTINRLSDVGISALKYSHDKEALFVGYANGNLDMVYANETINLSDFKRKSLLGDKRIYDILVVDDELYLATGIGILYVDLTKREIKETYVLGEQGSYLRVNALAYKNGYLYAATDKGFFKGERGATLLIYEEGWERMSIVGDTQKPIKRLVSFGQGWLLVASETANEDQLFYMGQNGEELVLSGEGKIYDLVAWRDGYAIALDQAIVKYTPQHVEQTRIGEFGAYNARPRSLTGTEEADLWVADNGAGLVKLETPYQPIIPNGPYGSEIFQVHTAGTYAYAIPGAVDEAWSNTYRPTRLFAFNNNQWQTHFDYTTYDVIDLAADPFAKQRIAMASWGSGLLVFEGGAFTHFGPENSSLTTSETGDFCRVGGCTFDEEGNLWLTQANASSPLHVMTQQGEWQNFDFDGQLANVFIADVVIDEAGVKWLLLPRGGGLWVYDDNQTPLNEHDDRFKAVPIVDENGAFITNDVYAVAKDLEGQIWVGTGNGVVIFSNPEAVFEGELLYARRPIITIDNVTERLLNGNIVTSIAVDGANRKWFGTRSSGAFLTSSSGDELEEQFTTENSPLLSNHLLSIAVNDLSGEVFLATREGLLSYGGSATLGGDDFGDVYVYPNPVRENYSGDIVVRGLLRNALVKITDVSGNVVYETRADGGQAVWNGKNFDGKRVSTGVYLVFCTNSDGSKTHITKLLFVR